MSRCLSLNNDWFLKSWLWNPSHQITILAGLKALWMSFLYPNFDNGSGGTVFEHSPAVAPFAWQSNKATFFSFTQNSVCMFLFSNSGPRMSFANKSYLLYNKNIINTLFSKVFFIWPYYCFTKVAQIYVYVDKYIIVLLTLVKKCATNYFKSTSGSSLRCRLKGKMNILI